MRRGRVCRGNRLPLWAGAGNVVLALCHPRNQRRGNQRGAQSNDGRERLRQFSKQPQMRGDRQDGRQRHGAHAHRVDVVQMCALELNAGRAQAQRLVDDQIGHHRHHPGNGDVGVQAQHIAQCLKHVHLHQHEGNQGVEHHPHHPPGVTVREAREKIAPGQRAGIGVGHIDLELRNHHKDGRGCHRPAVSGKHVFIGRQVHLVRIHGPVHRYRVADGQISQERTAQHLAHAQHHPTRPTHEHTQPPAAPVGRSFGGHEAQVVRLLAHLRHQSHADGQSRTKQGQTEPGAHPFLTDVVHHA